MKKLLLTSILLGICILSKADNGLSNLIVWTKDGSKVAYPLVEKPKVTFSDTYMTIQSNGQATFFPLNGLVRFTYEEDPTPDIKIANIELDVASLDIKVGEAKQLTATILPTNATNQTLTWASQNSKVAAINADGIVTAIGVGTTTITATATDGSYKDAICTVNVAPTEYTIINVSGTSEWSTWMGTKNLSVIDGLEAYILTDVDTNNGTVTLSKQSFIKANTPTILRRTGETTTFQLPTTNTVTLTETACDMFKGTQLATNVTTLTTNNTTIYILVNDQFIRTRSGIIPSGKCYLAIPSITAARLNIMFDDETNAIQMLKEQKKPVSIYNMNGTLINNDLQTLKKGVYIIGGEKKVVK